MQDLPLRYLEVTVLVIYLYAQAKAVLLWDGGWRAAGMVIAAAELFGAIVAYHQGWLVDARLFAVFGLTGLAALAGLALTRRLLRAAR